MERRDGLLSSLVSGPIPKLYWGLVVVRVISALMGMGYIHPDEYYQNGEVTAGEYALYSFSASLIRFC